MKLLKEITSIFKLNQKLLHVYQSIKQHTNNQGSVAEMTKTHTRPCHGCGSHSHGQKGHNNCATKCSAWGTHCQKYKIPNHFACVCHKQQSLEANALIAGITPRHPNQINLMTIPPSAPQKIPTILSLCLP